MIPAATTSSYAAKPAHPAPLQTVQKSAQPPSPETARTSVGETGSANVRAETLTAIQANEQSSVPPRLRDRENAERSQRLPARDEPTGPPPAFEESPLERQARVALDPPDMPHEPEKVEVSQPEANAPETPPSQPGTAPATSARSGEPPQPPPSSTERAEASFAETKGLSKRPEHAVDIAR